MEFTDKEQGQKWNFQVNMLTPSRRPPPEMSSGLIYGASDLYTTKGPLTETLNEQ